MMSRCIQLLIIFCCFSQVLSAQNNDEIIIEGPQDVCEGCYEYYVSYLGEPNIQIVDVSWILPNGETLVTTGDSTHTVCWNLFAPGSYSVPVVVTLSNGNVITTEYLLSYGGGEFIYIESTANQVCPAANNGGSGGPGGACEKLCPNSTVTYTVNNNQSTQFSWNVVGAVSWEQTNFNSITVQWGDPGTGSVSVFSFGFCENYSEICVEILEEPIADFNTNPSATGNLLSICQGQTVYFENTSQGAASYHWTFGNLGTSDEVNPSQVFESPGTYEVSLIAYNECLCADTTSLSIEVIDAESPFVDCVGTVCEGETITYTSDADCGTFNWAVSPNGTITDGGGTGDDFVTVSWTNGPEGTIELIVDNCTNTNVCQEPNLVRIPILSDGAAIEGPELVCKGQIANYSVVPYEGTDFTWVVSNFGTILEGQGTNEITVEWFGGFIVTQAQSVSVTYNNCYLECGGSSTLAVNMKPELYIDGPIEVCQNASIVYQAINTQNNMPSPANWTLTAADGTVVWTSPAATGSPMIDWNYASGTYTLSLVPANPLDFCITDFVIKVRVVTAPPPVNSIAGEDDICPGQPYTYEAISGQPNNTFRWSINDGGTISERIGNPINVTWGATAPYEISVIQVSTSGIPCESDAVVLPIQAISGFVIAGDDEVCQDQISGYSTTDYAEVDYVWTILPNGVGTITGDPNASSIEILWHTGGPATVSLDLCGQNTTFAVNVRPIPEPVAIFPSDLCANETAALSTTIVYDSYQWKNENGTTVSTSATPDLGPGYYQVIVSDAFGCVGDTTFFIDAYPESEINISTPDPNYFCNVPISTTMYGLNSSAGYSYQWFMDNTPIVGETGPIYTATAAGVYRLQITDTNNCTYFSNSIPVASDCNGVGGGPGVGVACDGSNDLGFNFTTTTECNVIDFQNLSVDVIPGSIQWFFDDPGSGSNIASGPNVSHAFSAPGFYRVFQLGDFDDGMGGTVSCYVYQVVEVPMSASFEYDNACPGEVVAFADLSTYLPGNSITSWAWDFGDPASGAANTSTDQNPTHVFDNPGDYLVSLTITAASGCTSTKVQTLSVYPPPPVNFEEPVVNCERTASNFIADVPATVTYVHWDFGDPTSGDANTSDLFDTYHVFDSPGTYTVTLFAQSIYGCMNSFTRTITIAPNSLAGDISLSIPSPLCEGDSTVLTPPAGGTGWTWSTSDTTETITTGEAGIYAVTITDADGCSYEPDAVVIDVLPAPEAPIRAVEYNEYQQPSDYFYENYAVCEGEDIFLEAIETTGYTYQWATGDVGAQTEYSDNRGNQLMAGDYEISLTVTDPNSCSNVITFSIVVHPLPTNVQIIASVGGLICESTETTFSVVSPDPALEYIWNTGEVGTSITTGAAGDYFVRAINAFGCETESNTLTIIAGPDISLVPSGCHTRCRPDTLCLPLIPGVVSYQWYFNGAPIPGPNGTQTDLIADQDGDYYLEMVSAQGCVLNSGTLSLEFYDGFGTFEGNVYYDVNENGIIDAADTLMTGIDINLLVANTITNTATSDANGFYQFANVLATDYTLELDTLSFPADVNAYVLQVDTALVGCDDQVEINWLLYLDCEEMVNTLSFTGCEGDMVTYNGLNFTSDTTFTRTYTSATGCDSTEMITIDILEASSSLLQLGTCPDETVIYEGIALAAGDQQDFILVNAAGCDSTVSVSVVALPSSLEQLQLEVCPGEKMDYNGTELEAGDQQEFVFINAAGCDSTVNVSVVAYAMPIFSLDTEESCPNTGSGNLEVNATGGNGPFSFSLDGASFQNETTFNDLPSGNYTLYTQDGNGCELESSFLIEALPELHVSAKEFVLPCDLLETTLEVDVLSGGDNTLTYLWDDGSTNASRLVTEPGTYTLMLSNSCESIEQPITVDYEEHNSLQAMYVPNAFSPNEDGVNDRFTPMAAQDIVVDKFEFDVFDRWGNQVFRSKDSVEGWDGARNGKPVKPGVYVWRLKAMVNVCGQMMEVVKEGDVTLLR